jgi:hypothetical protein
VNICSEKRWQRETFDFKLTRTKIQVKNDVNDGNDSNGDQDALNHPQDAQEPQIMVPVLAGAPGAPQ